MQAGCQEEKEEGGDEADTPSCTHMGTRGRARVSLDLKYLLERRSLGLGSAVGCQV